MLGIKAGFRISELIAIRVQDVMQYGKLADRVEVARQHMKGKQHSRSVPLHSDAREALAAWLPILHARLGGVLPRNWLRVLQTGLTSCSMWKNLILPCGLTSFT
jgi:site-specific recombinase XerD